MKRFLKSSLFMAAVLVAAIACKRNDIEIIETNPSDDVLTVSFGAASKVLVTPTLGTGATLTWQANDLIALYDKQSGELTTLFQLKSGEGTGSATFVRIQGSFDAENADSYTAVYPYAGERTLDERYKKLENQTQVGNDNYEHLKAYMAGDIEALSGGNSVTLRHELAAISFVQPAPAGYDKTTEVIDKFSYFDGNYTYTVNLEGIDNWDGNLNKLKVHLMVRAGARGAKYRVSVYSHAPATMFSAILYTCTESASSPSLEAGKLYYLQDDDDMRRIVGTTIADINTTPPTTDAWVVIDAIDKVTDLSVLKTKIAAQTQMIHLYLPFATGIKENSFEGCAKLELIDAPILTSVGHHAFKRCSDLSGINLPLVTNIDEGAFEECAKLIAVSMPSLTEAGPFAFYNCQQTTNFDFPVLRTAGKKAFAYCKAVTSVVLPSLTAIEESGFEGCANLETINMKSLTKAGYGAFRACAKLHTAKLPNLYETAQLAFSGTALASLDMPALTIVGYETFKNCDKLIAATLPSATKIEGYAFYACAELAEVALPKAETVRIGAFMNCRKLKKADLPAAHDLSEKDVFCYATALETVLLPQVTRLGYHTFFGCRSLKTMDIASKSGGLVSFDSQAMPNPDNSYGTCDLTVGVQEESNVKGNRWRGIGDFKSVTVTAPRL